MPYCNISCEESTSKNGTRIFYRTYGNGPIKILLIIGLAGTHDSWGPQIKRLAGTDVPNDEKSTVDDAGLCNGSMEVCAFDNRGMGRSSVPTKKSEYTSTIMAKDTIALMNHLGWKKAHVFGHSMGGMIACKLAALVPDRILSLALLNVTGGGFQCLPKLDRLTLSVAVRFLLAKTPEERAAVDLDTHYSQDYLAECVGQRTRRSILYQEYVKGISKTGMQSNHGFEGQINACWTHKVTKTDIERIRSAGFLISVIHGRHDIIAQISHAKRLAEKLHPFARMVDLHGGHLVSHERTNEVNEALLDLTKASECKTNPHEWTNLPDKKSSATEIVPNLETDLLLLQAPENGYTPLSFTDLCYEDPTLCAMPITSQISYGSSSYILMFASFSDWIRQMMILSTTTSAARSSLSSMNRVFEKLNGFLIYLFGVFLVVYEYVRRVVGRFKPVRIGSSLTA